MIIDSFYSEKKSRVYVEASSGTAGRRIDFSLDQFDLQVSCIRRNAERAPLLTGEMLRTFARIYTGHTPLEIASPENVRLARKYPTQVKVKYL